MRPEIEEYMEARIENLRRENMKETARLGELVQRRDDGTYDQASMRAWTKAGAEAFDREEAIKNGMRAFEELLHIAEAQNGEYTKQVCDFLAAAWGYTPSLDMETLHSVDTKTSGQMMEVLHVMRRKRADVFMLAVNGQIRVPTVLDSRGFTLHPASPELLKSAE